MVINKKLKYIAIKPKGFKHYLWFETEKANIINNKFVGNDGWGNGGALTNIECNESEIDSIIYSENLQYI